MTMVAFRSRPPFPQARLQVEPLEDRTVPAVLDLTTAGVSGTINGAGFFQAAPQPTGVGVINDFLRIQSHQGSVEQGYNTDFRKVQFDEKTDNHTRAIRVSALPTTTLGGATHRVVLLGINQKTSSPLLSLNELRLYVGDTPNVSGYVSGANTLGGLSAVYDMGDNWVKLDASLTHGNGSGDMYLVVPESLLTSPTGNPDPYFYLYSKFGVHFGSNGGFEQWAPGVNFAPPPPPPQPPAPASLSGYVYLDRNQSQVRDVGDVGLLHVQLTLTGLTSQGQAISITVTTNQFGFYTFIGLAAGTYTITESQPDYFFQGNNNLGTVNGLANGEDLSSDTLGNILLAAGDVGINYNFGEIVPGEF